MDRIGTLKEARDNVHADIQRCITTIRELAAQPISTPESGLGLLQRLRRETYEDLNQIQHEYSILEAAQWLIVNGICAPNTEWLWNPRQTGGRQEPDLRGLNQQKIIISAEVTTSEKPEGIIDTRMRDTLEKLSRAEGGMFYFVRTDAMATRARTKITKAGWLITVVRLPLQMEVLKSE
jgi:hypothetical protein